MKAILILILHIFTLNAFSQYHRINSTEINTVDTAKYDEFLTNKKQTVLLAINEIINGAIATRYIYQINKHEAYGTHLSIYINDFLGNSIQKENYKGFKFITFYQYYLVNSQKAGIYLEPKLSIGYFDTKDIKYYGGDEEVIYYSDKFWTAGLGASVGFMFYIKNSVALGFSFGVQYFPSGAPHKISIDGTEYSRISSDITYSGPPYWESFGPGAILDFKLFIGFKL